VFLSSYETVSGSALDAPFELYEVDVQVNVGKTEEHWTVSRRFSAFHFLYEKLLSRGYDIPEFPSRKLKLLHNHAFLRERHCGLQQFFNGLPQQCYETPEMIFFLNSLTELVKKGYSVAEMEKKLQDFMTARVTLSKEDTKNAYDKISTFYDVIDRPGREIRELSLKKLDAQPGEKILEIGFGTGQSIIQLAKLVRPTGMVHGIDISEGMLKLTNEKIAKSGISSENVVLKCADASQLPYADNLFDAVYMVFTLELFDTPEIPLVLSEVKRVLKETGRIVVAALSKRNYENSMATKLYEWFHENMEFVANCRPIYVQNVVENSGFSVSGITYVDLYGIALDVIHAYKNSKIANQNVSTETKITHHQFN